MRRSPARLTPALIALAATVVFAATGTSTAAASSARSGPPQVDHHLLGDPDGVCMTCFLPPDLVPIPR